MSKQLAPSVPLITNDPYFSVWSPHNALTDGPTESWTGAVKAMDGVAEIDGETYRFLGAGEAPPMKQLELRITATSSVYRFGAGGVELEVRFTSPLLLSDLELVSRPCTYVDFTARATDSKTHRVELRFSMDEAHCYNGGGVHRTAACTAAWLGREKQSPLNHSGDGITIDWGYLYLALPAGQPGAVAVAEGDRTRLEATLPLGEVASRQEAGAYLVAAYDDILSILYFGEARKAYWARNGKTILEAIGEAVADHGTLLTRCHLLDAHIEAQARSLAGDAYARVCALAYRQSIAAHKLVTDTEGKVVFLSKECYSNGCIGTADVSYPSVPLYLLHAPELVKGMLRPIFAFARMPVWGYDFAPHDVGRYPYAWGQVYGARPGRPCGGVYPPYYQFPAGAGIYEYSEQMPVEECGNMLIMTAAACLADDEDFTFAEENLDLLEKWACYLVRHGGDPGNQLCTDDFAGHLAHNVNLAAKAVMGVGAYALILAHLERDAEAQQYLEKAAEMAEEWEIRADRGDHTALTFDREEGWSLKYNVVWDTLFHTNLFTPGMIQRDIRFYLKQQNRYGVPLDSRKDYTKSDWILWVAAMAGNEDMAKLINPVAAFLAGTPDRVPFSDWYDTKTGVHFQFQNRTVQGGLFMPMLMEAWRL